VGEPTIIQFLFIKLFPVFVFLMLMARVWVFVQPMHFFGIYADMRH